MYVVDFLKILNSKKVSFQFVLDFESGQSHGNTMYVVQGAIYKFAVALIANSFKDGMLIVDIIFLP